MTGKKSLHRAFKKSRAYMLPIEHEKGSQNKNLGGCMVIYPEDYDLHKIEVE